jgi:hypothetical protein
MNQASSFRPVLFSLLAAVAFSAQMLAAPSAYAGGRNITVGGANGPGATRNVERSPGKVSSSTTGSQGRSTSRQLERSAEGATGTVTGPQGKTSTRTTTRTEDGSSTTVTGPNGETGGIDIKRQR